MGLKHRSQDQTDLDLRVLFEDGFEIHVYNDHENQRGKTPDDLVGMELQTVIETASQIAFEFGVTSLIVNLTDEAYTGPEALVFYGPNDLIVIWN